MSVGVDGESEDVLLGTAKPSIFVCSDQWVITAENALRRSTARVEYVHPLGISTPLGEVFVCRVIDEGTIMLAGLRHRRELVEARRALENLSPRPIWIDGAYGRIVGAHPDVADAVVVATGMIAASDLKEVVEKTESLVSRFGIFAEKSGEHRALIDRAVAEDRVLAFDAERDVVEPPIESAVAGLRRIGDWWRPTVEAVAIPGLVSDGVAEALLSVGKGAVLLVSDATAIHVDDGLWHRLEQRWQVRVRSAVSLAGISFNPTSPVGATVDSEALASALREINPDTPVFDPLQLLAEAAF